jgi:hypothetical protein
MLDPWRFGHRQMGLTWPKDAPQILESSRRARAGRRRMSSGAQGIHRRGEIMRLVVVGAALAAVALGLGGCATRPTPPAPMKIRLAALDFAPPNESYYSGNFGGKVKEGWWFGARSVYTDAHIGILAADTVARRLNRADLITVESRQDIRHYMAGKADVLRKTYPHATEGQIAQMLQQAVHENPKRIGEELGVDRVLTGHIVKEHLVMNRASKAWKSSLQVRLVLLDVETGDKVFDKVFSKTKWFASMDLTLDELANDVAEFLKDEYGYR